MADSTRVIEFDVAGNTYCVEISHVDQVVVPGELNDAPDLDENAVGVMMYRETAIEVWDTNILLSNEDVAMVERKRKLDAEISGTFEDITDVIQRLVNESKITADDATELTDKLNDLRQKTVSGPVDIEPILDQMDVIVLSPDFQNADRRIGWLVDEVRDVRTVTRDDLDRDEVGGKGVYGVLREDEEDEEKEVEELTIWINPRAFFE